MDTYDISMAVGPPGTGKSHIIAAMVIDLINNNKSVLVASKNNQTGQVIINKIEKEFHLKKILVKSLRQTYKRSLISKFKRFTYGITGKSPHNLKTLETHIEKIQKEINSLTQQLANTEELELKWGEFFYENKNSFFERLKSKWIEYRNNNLKKVWKINEELKAKEKSRIKHLKRYVKYSFDSNLRKVIASRRSDFLNFTEALEATSSGVVDELFSKIDFKLILKAIPAWVCSAQDLANILPLEKELFDVAIIDEASQCDIATMIPIIYRAKKIVVVGDPKQLRHYSFLSDFQQEEYKKKYNITDFIPNYRRESLVDFTHKVIAQQNQINFLNEHYRSKPDIIRFSKETFYDDQLLLMRESPHSANEHNTNIVAVGGKRNTKGVNEEEADSLIKKIKEIIKNEKIHSDVGCSSIGIISPFTSQVSHLKSFVRKELASGDIKKHEILIGTPYHFQGEERDVIFLSFAIDNDSHPAVYNYLNKEDVFNVTITRARNFQHIYTSIDYKTLDSRHLVSRYLNNMHSIQEKARPSDIEYDGFAEEVIQVLSKSGYENIFPSTYVAGVEIDIAVVANDKTYCIDLIGYPGKFNKQFTHNNMQMLNRMKQEIFFIPYSCWNLDQERTIKNLLLFLGR